MLCATCSGFDELLPEGDPGYPAPAGRRGRPVSMPRCERCGAPVASTTLTEALLRTLQRLASFGLTAGFGPLLGSRTKR